MNHPKNLETVGGTKELPAQPLNIMFSLYYESGEDMEDAVAPPPKKVCEPIHDACEGPPQSYNGAA